MDSKPRTSSSIDESGFFNGGLSGGAAAGSD